jgi:hypothetical protein
MLEGKAKVHKQNATESEEKMKSIKKKGIPDGTSQTI